MSTRSVITVIEGDERYSIYRHSDGYPDGEHGVLATLEQALPLAWPLPRFEAMDFAAAIVGAWRTAISPTPTRSRSTRRTRST